MVQEAIQNPSKAALPEAEKRRILKVRHKARTDLEYLCRYILGMRDVCREVHGPVLDICQPFDRWQGKDTIDDWGRPNYTPLDIEPSSVLPIDTGRRRLILDPRAFLKTSIQVIGHTIQWILNFPDVAVLIMHASQTKAEEILAEVKQHFTKDGSMLRWYFPEYCPQGKQLHTFGNSAKMTVPNRQRPRKEATISLGAVEKKTASSHYHVIKLTDVVEETNVTTEDQRRKIADKFALCYNLLVDPYHWLDVEGTIYHLADLYCDIMRKEWHQKDAEKRTWKIHIRPVYKRRGVTKDFTPDQFDKPYLYHDAAGNEVDEKHANARRVSWWASWRNGKPKFTWEVLEEMREMNPYMFAAQMLLNPIEAAEQLTFPLDKMRWVPAEIVKRVPVDFHLVSVDTASTDGRRSNSSAITTCLWDTAGRQIMVDGTLGKFLPDALIDEIFKVVQKWRPLAVYIELTEFVRGLKPSIMRKCQELGVWPNFVFIPPDTHTSKIERIERT
jgi:hypothetical protein